jgi:hypothetical protein
MLIVIKLCLAFFIVILSAIILGVIMLSVVAPYIRLLLFENIFIGATTLSITASNVFYAEPECRIFIVTLSVIMMNVVVLSVVLQAFKAQLQYLWGPL